jgi:hypothetical protein
MLARRPQRYSAYERPLVVSAASHYRRPETTVEDAHSVLAEVTGIARDAPVPGHQFASGPVRAFYFCSRRRCKEITTTYTLSPAPKDIHKIVGRTQKRVAVDYGY